MNVDVSRWCPGNPANTGHEPLHTVAEEEPDMLRFKPGIATGPTGTIHFCRHCRLAYFVEIDAAPTEES